jgi:2-keto-4-pentenoate hydratase/2-oxohepta-3-ene-1,7-dioic acid hydratase in catechol pathway
MLEISFPPFALSGRYGRTLQIQRGGQSDKGKSTDTFGSFLVTRDPQYLTICLEVDGHRCQTGSTRTIVFWAAYLVS